MKVIPAIDIQDGKVVRLFKGRFDAVTEYGSDPVDMARHWQDLGAEFLHVVDLDGARTGERKNEGAVRRIVRSVSIPVEVGGGIRSAEVVDAYLDFGVARVVLGTRIVDDKDSLARDILRWQDRVAVSLDCSKGFVARRGWQETSTLQVVDFARELETIGVRYVVYTDISRDGTLAGPDIGGLMSLLAAVRMSVIASGGVKDLEDIRALLALKSPHLWGVITGKAVYEGTLDFKAALGLCSPNG